MDLQLNADRFSGDEFTKTYDQHRPHPPREILLQCLQYLRAESADTVLDIGCGTGISTQAWDGLASNIIGIDPSEGMLEIAKGRTAAFNSISYLQSFSHSIALPDESADIICCSQSFHWMEPVNTLREVHRLLKKGGVFAVYDCAWPPSFHWEAEMAYRTLFLTIEQLTSTLEQPLAHKWTKDSHLTNLHNSAHFRYVKKGLYHKTEQGGTEQFIGIALSQGGLQALLNKGFSAEEIGLSKFLDAMERFAEHTPAPLGFHYTAFFAIK
ncbi:MAG: class I SAM-dependent methyltransferase [Bacteroidota bacterium]